MESIAKTLKENWTVVIAAPYAFLICIVVVGAALWAIISYLKANETSTLEARLKLRDDEITGLKRDLAAATALASSPAKDARQDRRRALIAEGRRQVAEFNAQTKHQHLMAYLAEQSEWPAIRAKLDPKVLGHIENGRMVVLTDGNGKDGKTGYLLGELDRLEKEWGLI